MKIPNENKQWSYSNSGKVFGNITNAKNIHFDDEGRLTLSKRPVCIYTNNDNASFRYLMSIVPFNTSYFLLTSITAFTYNPSLFAVTGTALSPTFGIESDAVGWQNRVYTTTSTDLRYYDTDGLWTASVGSLSLTSLIPHPLCVFNSSNSLAVANGKTVYLLNTSHTTTATLTIPDEYYVTSIRYRDKNLYIGTKHRYYGEAHMFVWNGSGTAAQSSFGVKSNWIYSMEEYQSSIVLVTNAGQLLRFNGGGFDPLANFPIYYSQRIWQSASYGLSAGKIFNRGIVADGDILYINIDGSVSSRSDSRVDTYLKNQPSGLWCFDPKVGLYPRTLSTADRYVTSTVSSINATTNELTLSVPINAQTGEPCLFSTIGTITGVTQSDTYYVIRVSSTVIKLAMSEYDAQQGTVIDLAGSIGGTERIIFVNYSKIGDVSTAYPGAVGLIGELSDPVLLFDTNVIWGGALLSTTAISSTVYALNSLSIAQNIGSFEVQRLYSPNVKDIWQKLYIKYGGLNLDTDKIIIKSRSKDRFGAPSVINDTATWIDTRAFSVPQTYKNLTPFQVGDEIVITYGSKAGYTTHITDIYNGAGTWVIGVEDAIGIASETFYFYADSWKKIATIDNDNPTNSEGYAEITLGDQSTRIDLKIEMYGHEMFIEELDIRNIKEQ